MSRLRAYLQLMRFPAVFTSLADIVAGYAVAGQAVHAGRVDPFVLFFLMAASAGLYLAGMVFNDVFDRAVDARERPGRPIPSGRVPLERAVILGGMLCVTGIAAASSAGVVSLAVALLLTAAVFAYDGWLKATRLGPVAMGACRFLNVLLGASGHPEAITVWQAGWSAAPFWVAAGMGSYIVGVTWFARNEAGQSRRSQLIGAAVVLNVGLLVLLGWLAVHLSGQPNRNVFLLAFVLIAATIDRRVFTGIARTEPAAVQQTVRTLLLSIIMLDAVLVFAASGSAVFALGTVALLIPATTLGRWIYVT
jgi:4-hydroxybenzoate polyprenyltransferase